MPTAISDAEAAEIDEFLAEDKRLDGIPIWRASPRPRELSAVWNIQDSLGIFRAKLRFRCPRAARAWPSISLIFRNNAIWRIDLVAAEAWKPNPPDAVSRRYLLSQDLWSLPYRRPLPAQIRRLPQAVASLGREIKLFLEPEQRRFDVPPQTDLFEELHP